MIYDNYNSFSAYVILRDYYDNKSHKLGYGPPKTMDTYVMYTTIHNTVCIYNTICKKILIIRGSVLKFWLRIIYQGKFEENQILFFHRLDVWWCM